MREPLFKASHPLYSTTAYLGGLREHLVPVLNRVLFSTHLIRDRGV